MFVYNEPLIGAQAVIESVQALITNWMKFMRR